MANYSIARNYCARKALALTCTHHFLSGGYTEWLQVGPFHLFSAHRNLASTEGLEIGT